MIFDKLANALTKHYKIVLVLWVLILLISVPAIMQVNNVVKYENTGVSFGDYDSVKAQDIISSEFQTSVANSTLVIVLKSDNMTDAGSRDFVLALQQKVLASGDTKYLQETTTIYTISEMMMDQIVMELGPNMRPLEQQVNDSAFLLWGIPSIYASNFDALGSDSDAYNATKTDIAVYLNQKDAQETESQLVMGYLSAFAAEWNSTSTNLTLVSDPMARADHCVASFAPGFITSLLLTSDEQMIMQSVLASFSTSNFDDQDLIHTFALGAIGQMASVTNMTFLQEVYDLGPSYEFGAVDGYIQSVIANGTLDTYPVQIPDTYASSLISTNGKTMLISMSFSVSSDYVESNGDKPMLDDVKVIRGLINDAKSETGIEMTTYVTGEAAISADVEASSTNDMALIEPITIAIIIVLMGILFRSVFAQFLPLGAVMVALGISQALVFVIGSTVAHIDSSVLTMLFSILMGVGTDYSIFIVTRYREERIKGATREAAVHTSVTWAGESIVTSGATVVIAFFAMSFSSFSFVQTMGLVIGMSIVVALLVALTLVPAIIMMVGNRIFWPNTGKRWEKFAANIIQRKKEGNHGYFHRAASFAVKNAKVIVAIAIVISIPATYIYLTAEPSFDFIGSMGKGESIDGMEAMTDDFGAGRIMPTQIVITGDTAVYENGSFNIAYLNAIENLTASIASDSMVQEITGVTRPYGATVDYGNLSAMPEAERTALMSSMLQSVGSSNKTVLLTVILKQQPESADSVDYISTLRDEVIEIKSEQPGLSGSTILVGGTTASLYDLSLSITEQFTNIEWIVIIGIFIVLMIVLGSLLLPLFAVVSIAMSIVWSFALTQLIFGNMLGEPILFMVPLILFIMLMGIGMDYNVFILTRIREEVHKGKDYDHAIIDAVDWTGGIITALALIMGGAFASMMLSSNSMLVEFGFALAVAILLDAMVVRTYIVPAAMSLMGKWAWWAPGPLQREGRENKGEK